MRKKLLGVTLAVMTLALAACGSKDNTTQKENEQKVTTRVAVDSENNKVEIPAEPKRIVDLSGSSDILSVLGFDVVGTCNSDGYDYTKLPSYLEDSLKDAKILGYSMSDTVDVEAIIGLKPDLIIISKVQAAAKDQLAKIAPTLVVNLEQVDFKKDFNAVAKIMDKENEAKQWLENYDKTASEVSALMKEKLGENATYLSFLASAGSNCVFTNAALGNILYDDLGLARPAKLPEQNDMTLPVVTNEGLAKIDADYMFVVATEEDKANLEKDAVYQNLRAVKDNNVIMLTASPYFNQGYSPVGRLVFLEELKSFTEELSK